MARFKPHHYIPGLRRPFLQRNEARAQRNRALAEIESLRQQLQGVLDRQDLSQKQSPAALFVPPGHFYSPIVDTREADKHLQKLKAKPVPESVPGIALDPEGMIEQWNEFLPFFAEIPFRAEASPGLRYHFDNQSFEQGDGSVLYAMLRARRPKQIIEIGCGWSSACMLDTIDRYLDARCKLTFIEPYPELLKKLCGDSISDRSLIEAPVQDAPLEIFEALEQNDILFIDSTHVLRTGSDVCFELFEILPRLKAGVIVHFHDTFWPFEYPRNWVVDENRSWNELYALRAYLTKSQDWRILFFNDYFAKIHGDLIEASYPDFFRNSGGSLWLQRR